MERSGFPETFVLGMERSGFPETFVSGMERSGFPETFVSGMERSGFPETQILLGFGKSYLIPETTNFDIGEGIVYKKGLKPITTTI